MTRLVRPVFVLAGLALLGGLFVSSRPAAAATTTVAVGDFYFCSPTFDGGTCQTTVQAGDTVVWDFSSGESTHTTTSDASLWNSGNLTSGTFQFTFTQAGTFAYRCTVHPDEMRGTIIVQAAAASPTSPPAGVTPAATSPGQATPVAGGGLPVSGAGPRQSGAANWWLLGALIVAGASLSGLGLAYARRRQ